MTAFARSIRLQILPLLLILWLTGGPAYAIDAAEKLLYEQNYGNRSLSFDSYKAGPATDKNSDCDTDLEDLSGSPTQGPLRVSCRTTRLMHLPNAQILRFTAAACRNGKTTNLARFKASAAADMLMAEIQRQAAAALGSPGTTFVNDRQYDHCVPLASSVPDTTTSGETPPSAPPPDRSAQNDPSQDDHPNQVIFTLRSKDRYKLGVEFFSQDNNNAWPGGNEEYVLSRAGTYRLNCRAGEKICYGAWRDNQNVTWGAGRRNEEACDHCCTTCGNELEDTLTDGGPDAGPPPAIFTLHNKDRYKLGVEFTSNGRAWPGNNQQYNLSGNGTYRLNCSAGEKICFGAWRDHQTLYWGRGHGSEGCSNCCVTCGGNLETTLNDGGADSYASNGGGSREATSDLIDSLNGLLQSIPSSGGGGGGMTSRPVTPRPRTNNNSTITGH